MNSSLGQIAATGYALYEMLKERNTGQVVDPNACGMIVNTYMKDGVMDGPGGHTGPCGVKKDHRRVYCCKNCQSHWQ
jgi:hypothetical protein